MATASAKGGRKKQGRIPDYLLVETKFFPKRPSTGLLERQKLLARLSDSLDAKLMLVTGSAGFGKTTLLMQWRKALIRDGADVVWLSLTRDDRALPNFGGYLISALQRLGVATENDLLLLMDSERSTSIDDAAAAIVNAAAATGRELYLLLDDYQHVEDARSHRLLQKIINLGPSNLHITISSRSAPPLSISRLRATGQLMEISSEELLFDLEETFSFFAHALKDSLSTDEICLIHDLSMGWPTNLQLIANELNHHPLARSRLSELVLRTSDLETYLHEDVLPQFPQRLVTFVEELSVCRRFNEELASYLTGCNDAAELLAAVEKHNLFIFRIELEDRFQWYRFHPLFAEIAEKRLRKRAPERVQQLHKRASEWFSRQGYSIDAVRHAGRSGDIEYAVTLVEGFEPRSWSLGYLGPLLSWIDRLPREVLHRYPRLFLLGCLTFAVTSRPHKAEEWVAAFLAADRQRHSDFEPSLAFINALIAVERDDTVTAQRLLRQARGVRLDNAFLRSVYNNTLALALVAAGRYTAVHKLFLDAAAGADDATNDMVLVAQACRALAYLWEGNVRESARLSSLILELAERHHGRRSVCASICATLVADSLYELGHLNEARAILANRLDMLQFSTPEIQIRASLCATRLYRRDEGVKAALGFSTREQLRFEQRGLERGAACLLAEHQKISLLIDDRNSAADATESLALLAERHREVGGFRAEIPALAALAKARLALADRLPDKALQELIPARCYAEAFRRGQMQLQTKLLSAVAHDQQGEPERVNDTLLTATRLGCRLGMVTSFLDTHPNVEALLRHFVSAVCLNTPERAHLQKIFALARETRNDPRRVPNNEALILQPYDALSEREREIVTMLAASVPNKRIASALDISLNTVKWHLKNIYGKLGVSTRFQAFAKARKLGLIE